MCLKINVDEQFIAKTDMVVYKVYRIFGSDALNYYSPFQNWLVPVDKKLPRVEPFKAEMYPDKTAGNVFLGYHSFVNVDDAFNLSYELDSMNRVEPSDYVIARRFPVLKCVIPANTPYYVGTWDSNNISAYASAELVLGEEILNGKESQKD